MTSSLFSNYEVEILCKIRSRNLDVKSNFKTKYSNDSDNDNLLNLQCKMDNCEEVEDQKHILTCKPILEKLDKNISIDNISYDHLFQTPKKQKRVTQLFIALLDIRESLLKEKERNM